MFLPLHGIQIPENYNSSYWSSGFIKWLGRVSFEYEYDRQYLDQYIAQLQYQRNLMTQVLLQRRNQCNSNNVLKCVRSVTGLGTVSAFTFYSELIDMKRFKELDHLASYVGLVPSKDSTRDKKGIKGLIPRYSRYVRYLLVECAWRAIGSDPALTAAYADFTKRMTKQQAIIKIARKLLNRIRYVWLNEKMYVTGVAR